MKKLKILLINDRGYLTGGVEINVLKLSEELKKRGHTVKILTSDINPTDVPLFSDYTFRGYNENSVIRWFKWVFNLDSYFKLKQILKEYKPDIIHLQNIFYQVSPSILLAAGNIPTILTLHSYELICPPGTRVTSDGSRCVSPGKHDLRCTGSIKGYVYEVIKQFIHKFLFKKISIYIAPSKSIKRDFLNQHIISSSIVVVHNGIKLMKISPILNYKNLLYVGRLSKEKGASVLLEATKLIKVSVPDIIVDIVGDGPDRDMLISLSKHLGIEKNIRFVGNIPHDKIEDFYKKCTLLIVPSVCSDNFPTVCIEAMSVGRPTIGSNVGGIPELVDDGNTGFLVQPDNPRQIAAKTIHLLSDSNLIKVMSEKAVTKSKSLSLDENVNSLEQLYKKIVASSRNIKL